MRAMELEDASIHAERANATASIHPIHSIHVEELKALKAKQDLEDLTSPLFIKSSVLVMVS